jgi:hypothetical protein
MVQAGPWQKATRAKRARGVVQVAECLASKYKALSSNPSITKIAVNQII